MSDQYEGGGGGGLEPPPMPYAHKWYVPRPSPWIWSALYTSVRRFPAFVEPILSAVRTSECASQSAPESASRYLREGRGVSD